MSDIRRATGRDLLPIVMFFHGKFIVMDIKCFIICAM